MDRRTSTIFSTDGARAPTREGTGTSVGMANSGGKYEGNIPDGITPIVGVRAWRVQKTLHKEDRLFSIYKAGINWPIGRRLEAKCIQPSSIWAGLKGNNMFATKVAHLSHSAEEKLPEHQPPYDECTCGIYALNSFLTEGEIRPWQSDAIVGVVLLWGHVLEGDRGYRAQYAKVVALWMDSENPERIDLITQMAEMYKVPIVVDLTAELERQRMLQGGGR